LARPIIMFSLPFISERSGGTSMGGLG